MQIRRQSSKHRKASSVVCGETGESASQEHTRNSDNSCKKHETRNPAREAVSTLTRDSSILFLSRLVKGDFCDVRPPESAAILSRTVSANFGVSKNCSKSARGTRNGRTSLAAKGRHFFTAANVWIRSAQDRSIGNTGKSQNPNAPCVF